MSGKRSCKGCGSFDLESDPCRGDIVCTQCGIVLEDSVIISEVQFEENAHGGSSAIGQFVSSNARSAPLSVVGPYTYGVQKESKEITMQKAKAEMSRIAQQLRISTRCIEIAEHFYRLALNQNLTKGRRSSICCAACLYIACRLEQTPHLLIDFSDLLQVDPFFLGRTFTTITNTLFITLPIIAPKKTAYYEKFRKQMVSDPCLYVLRYANQLNLGNKTQDVVITALRVLKRMKIDFLHCGRRPAGLCGSALIIATRLHKIRKKLKDIVNVVHIQEVTLKKRLLEFGDTPSSLLTPAEFMEVNLGEEQDPPSFKAARLKDKERLKKFEDVNYEMKMRKLKRLIEKELDKKRGKGTGSYSVCGDHGAESSLEVCPPGENADSCDKSKLLLADVVKDDIEDESDVVRAVVDSTIETIDTVCTNLTENSSSANVAPTTDSTGNVVDGNTEDATLLLDNCLSDLDEDEIDSYIVTEEQFKQKEEAWTKLNQEYLEEQKKKEEERRNREKEEEGKPEKKRKRPKKQKPGIAATAGEAAEKILREKKISNKLNYDVLKSLNIDDFVKSMNFAKPISRSSSAEAGEASCSKTVSESTTKTLEPAVAVAAVAAVVEDEEPMEQDDYYDEADDFDEQDDDDVRGESVSKLLRKEFVGDEEYDDEDYGDEYD